MSRGATLPTPTPTNESEYSTMTNQRRVVISRQEYLECLEDEKGVCLNCSAVQSNVDVFAKKEYCEHCQQYEMHGAAILEKRGRVDNE